MKKEIKRLGGEGILNEEDIKDFSRVEKVIIENIREGVWYSAEHIIKVVGQREALRRLRDLRKKNYLVERKRVSDYREFFYRIRKLDNQSEQG
jgi:hypothetical protein